MYEPTYSGTAYSCHVATIASRQSVSPFLYCSLAPYPYHRGMPLYYTQSIPRLLPTSRQSVRAEFVFIVVWCPLCMRLYASTPPSSYIYI